MSIGRRIWRFVTIPHCILLPVQTDVSAQDQISKDFSTSDVVCIDYMVPLIWECGVASQIRAMAFREFIRM
jgi:uncharacterized protein YcsI (UPF0317 family)